MIISSGFSDKGRIRELNEDSWYTFEPSPSAKCFYAMVADGMGGHNAGEIASRMTVIKISEFINKMYNDSLTYDELKAMLLSAVEEANRAVKEESVNNETTSGMGTTLVLCFITGYKAIILHVGDSRLYIIRGIGIHRITKDHSLVAELVKQGKITEREASTHPQKNVLTRAMGTDPKVDVDMSEVDLKENDIILICSDGLSNMLTDIEIGRIILESENIIIAPVNLVHAANEKGGTDNITAVLLKIAPDTPGNEKGRSINE